jgi:hypothetical protein
LKYVVVFAIAFAACRGEQRAPQPKAATPAAAPTTSTHMVPAPPPAPVKISSASKCAGNGSYNQAVDCFRIATGVHFKYEEPLVTAEGELTRPRPGMERVQFRAAGGEWVGEAKPQGLIWTRDGKHEPNPPAFAERVYQRVATYADPQKKEEKPQLAGTDLLDGEPYNIYVFTNNATGAKSEVCVSEKDGRMMRIKVTPLPQLADSSPEYTLELR